MVFSVVEPISLTAETPLDLPIFIEQEGSSLPVMLPEEPSPSRADAQQVQTPVVVQEGDQTPIVVQNAPSASAPTTPEPVRKIETVISPPRVMPSLGQGTITPLRPVTSPMTSPTATAASAAPATDSLARHRILGRIDLGKLKE